MVDRDAIVELVENFWRSVIPMAQAGRMPVVRELTARFDQQLDEAAKQMLPFEGVWFRQSVEAERTRLVTEYLADPAALKTRLGVPQGNEAVRQIAGGDGIGDLVVRTAVRATIWEGLWALFRAIR